MFKLIAGFLLLLGVTSPQIDRLPPEPLKPVLTQDLATFSVVEADNNPIFEEIAIITEEVKETEHLCSCVEYVRSKSRYQPDKVVAAIDIPAIVFSPKVGGWLLWKAERQYSKYGHASYIEEIVGTSTLHISEHNLTKCKTTHRFVSVDDSLIRGYFWHDLW